MFSVSFCGGASGELFVCDRASPGWRPAITRVSSTRPWPQPAASYSGKRIPLKPRAGQGAHSTPEAVQFCKPALRSTRLFLKIKVRSINNKSPSKQSNKNHPNYQQTSRAHRAEEVNLAHGSHRIVIPSAHAGPDLLNSCPEGLGAGY